MATQQNPRRQMAAIALIIGGVLIAAGSLMPWVEATAAFVGSLSRSGIDGGGDGVITLSAGVVVALVGLYALVQTGQEGIFALGAVGGLVAAGIAIVNYNEASGRVVEFTATAGELGTASVGAGLWVLGAGGVVALVAAATGLFSSEASEQVPPRRDLVG